MEHPAEHPNRHGVINPYSRRPTGAQMGPQSQRRLALNERTHTLQANSNKRKAGQLTLFGGVAFDPSKNCVVCKAKLAGRTSHKAHHNLCTNNKRTQGRSAAAVHQAQLDKSLQQHFQAPLRPEEKASSRYLTKESAQVFFEKRNCQAKPTELTTTTTATATTMNSGNAASDLTGQQFCSQVTDTINNSAFQKEHEKSRAPLAMLAFAKIVMEKVNKQKQSTCFNGISMVVPACKEMHSSPQCHSIVGQKLLLVDWEKMHSLKVTCPCCK